MTSTLIRRLCSTLAFATVMGLTRTLAAQNPDGTIGPRAVPLPPDTNMVLVLPFSVRGPPEFAYLRESMAELLHMALDGVGGMHVVYSDAVQRRLNRLPNPTDPAAAAGIARSLRAARVISGSMVVDGANLQVRVEVYNTERRAVQFAVTGRGATARLSPVVDTIAASILARRLVPAAQRARVRLDDYATGSPRALQAYLAGVRLVGRGERREAADSLKAAIAHDSLFGPAHLRLGRLEAAQPGVTGIHPESIATRTRRLSDRFPERIRLLVNYGRGASGDRGRLLTEANDLAARYPNDADVAFRRADAHFHHALNLGLSRERVMSVFSAAMELVDDDAELLDHFVSLNAEMRDTAATWSAVRRCQQATSLCNYDASLRILYRGADPWRVAAESGRGPLPNMVWVRFLASDPAKSMILADSVEQVMGRSTNATARAAAYVRRSIIALTRGRYQAAWALLDTASSAGGTRRNHVIFYNTITGDRRTEAMAALSQASGTGDMIALTRAWNAVARGPVDSAELAIARLADATPRDSARYAANQTGLRALSALRAGDSTRARELFRSIRSLERRGGVRIAFVDRPLQPAVQMSLTAAQLEFDRGDYVAARLWLADVYPLHEALVHEAPAQELRARVCAAQRDFDCARDAYRKFIDLWATADPELQPRVATARLELARLNATP